MNVCQVHRGLSYKVKSTVGALENGTWSCEYCSLPVCVSDMGFFSMYSYATQEEMQEFSGKSAKNPANESAGNRESRYVTFTAASLWQAKMDGHAKRTITLFTDVIETKFENPRKGLEAFFQNLFLFFRWRQNLRNPEADFTEGLTFGSTEGTVIAFWCGPL